MDCLEKEVKRIEYDKILSLVEQKANRFGKVDSLNRVCRKKQTETRIKLVYHLILLTTILDYVKQGYEIYCENTIEISNFLREMMVKSLIRYVRDLKAKDCPFDEILSALTKKAKNPQVNNETLLLDIMQITMFGEYGKVEHQQQNGNKIRYFFFGDYQIGLSYLIRDFNKETMKNKQAQRRAMYEKATIYQKDNSEKINKYNRIKNKTRISIKELRERNIMSYELAKATILKSEV